jgi:hypothetical protein
MRGFFRGTRKLIHSRISVNGRSNPAISVETQALPLESLAPEVLGRGYCYAE